MPDGYNVENFCDKPCSVKYNDVLLGGTEDAVNITRENKYIEVTCNQAKGNVVAKKLIEIKMIVKAKFKEITPALELLLGAGKSITGAEIGVDVMAAAEKHPLVLSEIGGDRIHTINNAVVEKAFSYDVDGTKDHGIEITFEAVLNTSNADADVLYAVTSGAA
jgi:hypothetical protein